MSLSFSYRTKDPVPAETRQALRADAERVNQQRQWWCEGIIFYDDPHAPGHLVGDTKVYLFGYTTAEGEHVGVDAADDDFMAPREARFIAAQLARWSKEHGVVWEIHLAGQDIGTISEGRIFSYMTFLVGGEEEEPDEVERARMLDAKYQSRWD